jgi:hypothetical protein
MCIYFIESQGRNCKRSPQSEYCFQHVKKETKTEDEVENCSICLTKCEEKTICGHVVHLKCVEQWKDQCPMCRRENILPETSRRIIEERESNNNDDIGDMVISYTFELDIDGISIDIFTFMHDVIDLYFDAEGDDDLVDV